MNFQHKLNNYMFPSLKAGHKRSISSSSNLNTRKQSYNKSPINYSFNQFPRQKNSTKVFVGISNNKNNYGFKRENNSNNNNLRMNTPQNLGKNSLKNRQILEPNLGSLEDYQRLVKKYYNIIVSLQDELTKETIKNYSLIDENLSLKQKINEVLQSQQNN